MRGFAMSLQCKEFLFGLFVLAVLFGMMALAELVAPTPCSPGQLCP